jgi:quinol-cytochrome oxidoreductase complex cytochrome b subunit
MHKKKGIAGLNILLSVVTMVFVIGIIVMAFTLTSAKMQDATTDATAIKAMNDTSNAIVDVIDWFPIIITITAVVVLILLIVLIIVSLRSAGMMGGNDGA